MSETNTPTEPADPSQDWSESELEALAESEPDPTAAEPPPDEPRTVRGWSVETAAAEVTRPESRPEDEPPTTLAEAPPQPPRWKTAGLTALLVAGGDGKTYRAELSLVLVLDQADLIAPLLTAARRREDIMRLHVAGALAAAPELADFKAAAARVADLDAEQTRLNDALAQIGRDLDGAPAPDAAADLAGRQGEAQGRLNAIRRALAAARALRDEAARRVFHVAGDAARRIQAEALAEVTDAERRAAGLFEVGSTALDALVSVSSLAGAIRSPFWASTVSVKAAEAVAGPCPAPLPPPPEPAPAAPLGFGGRTFADAVAPVETIR